MIDLALSNIYFLGAALLIGIATARWAFRRKQGQQPETGKEDETRP